MTDWTGAGIGLLAGFGLLTAVRWSPPMRRPTLDDRLAPYLRDRSAAQRDTDRGRPTKTPFPTLERLLEPSLRRLAGRIDRLLGRSTAIDRRLEQADGSLTLAEFRIEQVLCGALGLLVGLVLAGLSAFRGNLTDPVAFLIVGVVLMLGGVVGRDQWLSVQLRRREQRILAEFPTIAEMLALSVTAGEGAIGALERITRLAGGELSADLGRALAEARTGSSLVDALDAMAGRTTLPALARFVDGIAIAVERGTPLADVLRSQAADVRDQGRRELLEAGGRKEIAMLVPVVFAVLPVTVLFSLYPGLVTLHLAVP